MQNQSLSKKPLFNLSKVLQETGIKADTLRAWERRYQLPTPSRTEGGHRLFSSYDIETIKWLMARQEEGMRISQAVDYWRELIAAGTDPLADQKQQSRPEPVLPSQEIIHQPLSRLTESWVEYALAFDEENAEQVLDAAFAQFPWETVATNLVFKGLEEIGEGWYSGEITIQQEHFASELVIRKLHALIANAPASFHPQKVLISSPPGEFHTIPPLMITLLLRYRGWDITYLGANVPDDHLEDALERIKPSLLVMSATRLTDAAALLETSQHLLNRGIPLAFGGNAFCFNPELIEKIPGTYLSDDLNEAVSRIEGLICEPELPASDQLPPNPFLSLKKEFQDKLPYLENQALLAIKDGNSNQIPYSVIQDANGFLFQDILAALTLGDINLLRPNIEWVAGLMKIRDYDIKDFKAFIRSFTEVTENSLKEQGKPLTAWLRIYLEELR